MARGRTAQTPMEIPVPGWKDILLRLKTRIAADRISLIAAGVAFYGLLALFPTITALMALAGLILDPASVREQLETLATLMPPQAATIVTDQAVKVAGSSNTGLGLAFATSLALAVYSASKGMGSLMQGLNVAYQEEETRSFLHRMGVTLALTILLILGLLLGLVAALAVPALIGLVGLPGWLGSLLMLARWLVLAVLTIVGIGVIYRFGPARADAAWRWLSPGALAACALWLAASIGFSLYVSDFGTYNETFGSMAGVIVLLIWLWMSAFIILLGAELNAEIEAQTRVDTTTGRSEPMGRRGAQKADRLGRAHPS